MGRIRNENPDAAYTAWPEAPKAFEALLKHPPRTPAIAPPLDFSTTPLLKKLGIGANMQVALIAAPDGFEELLGDLPANTTLLSRIGPKASLVLCFIRSLKDLATTLDLAYTPASQASLCLGRPPKAHIETSCRLQPESGSRRCVGDRFGRLQGVLDRRRLVRLEIRSPKTLSPLDTRLHNVKCLHQPA
jgi:hypothetical protein